MPSTATQSLNELRAERIIATQPVPFFTLSGAATELCPVGTVAVVAGLASSKLFQKVEAALVASDSAALNAALAEARDAEGEPAPLAAEERAVEVLSEQPAFADVRFLTRTLVSNVFVTPEVDFVRYYFPFAGGRLEPQDFLAAYFLKSEDAPRFKILVVVHAPSLSDEETKLVNSIPKASREMIVGEGPVGFFTTTIIATVTAGLVAAGIGYAIGRVTQHIVQTADGELTMLHQREADGTLKDLKPTSTVQALLAAKRKALSLAANK